MNCPSCRFAGRARFADLTRLTFNLVCASLRLERRRKPPDRGEPVGPVSRRLAIPATTRLKQTPKRITPTETTRARSADILDPSHKW